MNSLDYRGNVEICLFPLWNCDVRELAAILRRSNARYYVSSPPVKLRQKISTWDQMRKCWLRYKTASNNQTQSEIQGQTDPMGIRAKPCGPPLYGAHSNYSSQFIKGPGCRKNIIFQGAQGRLSPPCWNSKSWPKTDYDRLYWTEIETETGNIIQRKTDTEIILT